MQTLPLPTYFINPQTKLFDGNTCGFPLAEERKRRKTFFSHMTGSLGSSVWGVSGHVRRSCSLCNCYPPLPDLCV